MFDSIPSVFNIVIKSNTEADQAIRQAHVVLHIFGHFAGSAFPWIAEQSFEISKTNRQITNIMHFH